MKVNLQCGICDGVVTIKRMSFRARKSGVDSYPNRIRNFMDTQEVFHGRLDVWSALLRVLIIATG